MCVIAFKPRNQKIPDTNTLRQCFEHNSDGAGIMVAREGKVLIRKGFMTFEEFEHALDELQIKQSEIAVLHFRWASVGAKTPANCHPYPLSSVTADFSKTSLEVGTGVVHNGTIRSIEAKDELTDSGTFIRDILVAPSVYDNRRDKSVRRLINEFVGHSKILLLNADGSAEFFGLPRAMWTEVDGCLYSNTNWQRYTSSDAGEENLELITPTRRSGKRHHNTSKNGPVRIVEPREFNYTLRPKPISDFVNIDSICPACARSAYQDRGHGKRECSWCGHTNTT